MAKGTFTTPVTSGLYSQRGGLNFAGKVEAVAVVSRFSLLIPLMALLSILRR